jgi:pimeloyl-ACP methyl ester carboxylesterase
MAVAPGTIDRRRCDTPAVDEPITDRPTRRPDDGGLERGFSAAVEGGEIGGQLSGAGPRTLLLHGGPGLSDYLADLAAELAESFTVARYQQRGMAPSVTGGTRDIEGHVADAVAVLDGLGWDRAWVIGHSWGGHLAMHVAVAHPDRVAGIVVLDALGALRDGGAAAMGDRLRRDLPDSARARLAELDAREERGETNAEEQMEGLGLLWPYYFAEPSTAPPMPTLRFDLDGYAAAWASVEEHWEGGTLERGLPNLKMPSLFVHGELDPIPAEESRRSAALMPAARLEILSGLGHFPWIESPGIVRDLMAAWVAASELVAG